MQSQIRNNGNVTVRERGVESRSPMIFVIFPRWNSWLRIKMEATTGEGQEDLNSVSSGGARTLDKFLDHFLTNHRDDNFLSIKHGNYTVAQEDAIGEVVDWTMQYLEWM